MVLVFSEKTKREQSTDADDRVIYTWSLPERDMKRAEQADADDQAICK